MHVPWYSYTMVHALSHVPIIMTIIRMVIMTTLATRERARKLPRSISPVELHVPDGEVIVIKKQIILLTIWLIFRYTIWQIFSNVNSYCYCCDVTCVRHGGTVGGHAHSS